MALITYHQTLITFIPFYTVTASVSNLPNGHPMFRPVGSPGSSPGSHPNRHTLMLRQSASLHYRAGNSADDHPGSYARSANTYSCAYPSARRRQLFPARPDEWHSWQSSDNPIPRSYPSSSCPKPNAGYTTSSRHE